MKPTINRRDFLRHAALAAAVGNGLSVSFRAAASSEPALVQTGTATADDSAQLPIVDTHQHLWDLSKFNLPWTKGNETLGKSFVMSDYLAAAQGSNVVKSVYMEVDVDPTQQVAEAEYVIGLCQRNDNPMVAAVISGRPASDGFATYIEKFKDSPYIKGVRQVLHTGATPAGFCLQPQFVRSVQVLGELGLRYDLAMRPVELLDGDKLVAQCPKTPFVVDHCGNLSVQETDSKKRGIWMDGMKVLAQRSNVVCKISGIIASARSDWQVADLAANIRFALETFGPDRTMFASDWPVCTLTATFGQWVGALKTIVREMGMTPANQKKLFHDNAVAFYSLKDKPSAK